MITTRQFLFVLAIMVGYIPSLAQDWLSTYGPGSPAWCWQFQQQNNMIDMMNMQMQMNIHSFYQNQFNSINNHMMTNPTQPYNGGILTYDGVYVTPETVNDYHREDVNCEHCDGGYKYKQVNLGGGRTTTLKTRCTFCRGRGYVTHTVKNKSAEKNVPKYIAKASDRKTFKKTKNRCSTCSCSGYWGYQHQNGTYEGNCSHTDQYGHRCGHGPEKHGLRKW